MTGSFSGLDQLPRPRSQAAVSGLCPSTEHRQSRTCPGPSSRLSNKEIKAPGGCARRGSALSCGLASSVQVTQEGVLVMQSRRWPVTAQSCAVAGRWPDPLHAVGV